MTNIHEAQNIANTIKEQATSGALMSLGAYPLQPITLHADDERRGGALWDVRVLPMKKNGDRAMAPRKMKLVIEPTWADTYTVTVKYSTKGGAGPYAIHFQRDNVYWDQLPKLLLALDWDGDEILNPRYV